MPTAGRAPGPPGPAPWGCHPTELRLLCLELKVFVGATSQKLLGFTRFYLLFFLFDCISPPPSSSPRRLFALVWSSSNRWGVFLTTFASRKRREKVAPISERAQREPLASLPRVLACSSPPGTTSSATASSRLPARAVGPPPCVPPACPPSGSALTRQHAPFDVPSPQIRTLKEQEEGGEMLPRPPGRRM